MWPSELAPIPVVVPLLAAAGLGMAGRKVPAPIAQAVSLAAAAVAFAACVALMFLVRDSPVIHWFGGFLPRGHVCLGIDFSVDEFGAGFAALASLLTLSALVFAVGYFDSAGALFHVLMLVFLAALCGFSLTGDLFNLFVFFEVMGAAAIALCGYKSEEQGPMQGAFHLGVTNTLAAFLGLIGIALLYARTGALNLAQIGATLSPTPDALVLVAFALLCTGFLTKAAIVPFQFWLPDAHAVAPTPVCVLFSGVMVEAGLYAIARLWGVVFEVPMGSVTHGTRAILLGFGVATALVGATMAFQQRHLKRLLAFSTVAHAGLLLCGLALLEPGAFGGAALYLAGHGLVKGALFLLGGIVLHKLRSVDERKLFGRGRDLPALAALFVIGGLALAGCPPFGTFVGETRMEHAAALAKAEWLRPVFWFTSAVTAAAVLRVTGRTFFGLGRRPEPDGGDGADGESDETPETRRGPIPATMWAPPVALLALGLAMGFIPGLSAVAEHQGALFLDGARLRAAVLDARAGAPGAVPALASLLRDAPTSLAVTLAAIGLAGLALYAPPAAGRLVHRALVPLRAVHSGKITDMVAWLTAGAACLGGLFLLLLRTAA